MRVLLLGSGGREHALAWKISKSPVLSALFCAPGNPGTASVATNLEVNPEHPAQVVALAAQHKIDLVVVGPEAPLVAGTVDALRTAGVAVFGPIAGAARLEGSKAFAKEVMEKAHVPTAAFQTFSSAQEAEAYAKRQKRVVVKADGLAAGKGVVVAGSPDEAVDAVRALSKLGQQLVLEEVLEGEEVSVIALCDGERYALLSPAQDHKRVGDQDTGPNTGGMGAYAPVPFLSEAELAGLGETVIAPTLAELKRRGLEFRGALYAGLMLTAQGPRVLEYNCRLGDPEAQVLMLQLEEDLLPLLDACARGTLQQRPLAFRKGASLGVVLAAHGYPQSPRTGDSIQGISSVASDVQVFCAGAKSQGGQWVTSGGRVLTVCAHGSSLVQAREKVYAEISKISFPGMHFRHDIGRRALG